MLAHVWNELEHDLVYKPQTGPISAAEKGLLSVLGNQTLAGDGVIIRLLEDTTVRQRKGADVFTDEYDFVSRVRKRFADVENFHRHAEQLFRELMALKIDSPSKVDKVLLREIVGEPAIRGRRLIHDLQDKIKGKWSAAYTPLNTNSADVLLALVLEKSAAAIVARNPGGRGKGRPTRIAHLARLWGEWQPTVNDSAGSASTSNVSTGPPGPTKAHELSC